MRKEALAPLLSLLVILLLTLPLGSESYRRFKGEEGICHDRFDMLKDPQCNWETCNNLCQSKNYDRLYNKRCLDSITCECTHRCRHPP